MPLYFIDGLISAGKTTFLKSCEGLSGLKVVYEPVDDWMNLKAGPDKPSLFELYYSDKVKYGFMFQMVVLQSRIEHLLKIIENASNDEVILCERSFLTDKHIFAELILNDTELVVYNQWYNFLINIIKPKIDGIIYLRTNPEICMTRIKLRNRLGEENIDEEYINKLHIQHELWLNTDSVKEYPVLIIDGNKDKKDVFTNNKENLESFLGLCKN